MFEQLTDLLNKICHLQIKHYKVFILGLSSQKQNCGGQQYDEGGIGYLIKTSHNLLGFKYSYNSKEIRKYQQETNMNTEELTLAQPSLKTRPPTLRTSCPLESEQVSGGHFEQIKILKYVNDANQSLNLDHEKCDGLLSQQSPDRSGLHQRSKRDIPVFKTFGEKNQADFFLREMALSEDFTQALVKGLDSEADVPNFEPKAQKKANMKNERTNRKEKDNALLTLKQSSEKSKQKQENAPLWYNEYMKYMAAESECYFLANSKNYEKATLKITKSKIMIGPIGIDLSKVMKIKIFPSELCEQSMLMKRQSIMQISNYRKDNILKENMKINKYNEIKLTLLKNETFNFTQRYSVVALPQPKESYSQSIIPCPQSPSLTITSRLPQPFLSFSKIILKKLKQLYPTLKSSEWSPPDFPIRSVIKTSVSPFSKYNTKNFALIHGKIYKKSQVKGKWEKRYVIINETGIYSYRQDNDEKHSFEIEQKSIKYIWTWFTILKVDKQKDKMGCSFEEGERQEDMGKKMTDELRGKQKMPESWSNELNENQNPYLIVKIKHGFNAQTQFGIPVCGFDNEINKKKNWLFAFYKVMSQYEY